MQPSHGKYSFCVNLLMHPIASQVNLSVVQSPWQDLVMPFHVSLERGCVYLRERLSFGLLTKMKESVLVSLIVNAGCNINLSFQHK
jgi:hypothetical protein